MCSSWEPFGTRFSDMKIPEFEYVYKELYDKGKYDLADNLYDYFWGNYTNPAEHQTLEYIKKHR